MRQFLKTSTFLIAAILEMTACSCDSGSGNGDDGPAAVAPTNLTVTYEIVGQDSAHPNGDGSGMVNFNATAQNATNYSFTFPGGETQTATDGKTSRQFKLFGTNTYAITVKAFGQGNTSITSSTTVTVNYQPTLVWSEEFDTPGAPDNSKWTLETGNNNGWGNNEAQYYTTDLENAVVENGVLKITAKKEDANGFQYSSARMKSENKFEFTYGKIEARAKLPSGAGTWPAIWMLGENYASAGWPGCGEIDIMEHVGNQQNTIHSTLHYPGHSGGNANTNHTAIPTASTEFHIYTCEWTSQNIKFFVDGVQFFSVLNTPDIPFHHDFFLILNQAIGGNFGGAIDPNFTQSTLEIDYIRVYQ